MGGSFISKGVNSQRKVDSLQWRLDLTKNEAHGLQASVRRREVYARESVLHCTD